MRYMFLIYSRERDFAEASTEDRQLIKAGHWAVMDETRKRGVLLAGEPLQPTATATTIRKENGKPFVLDGPFAETKEQLAGYLVVDCESPERAREIAARIPDARFAAVEVHPIMDSSGQEM